MVRGLLDDISVAEFDRAMNINVRGMFFAAAAVRHMPFGGRIINIGSNTAVKSNFCWKQLYVTPPDASRECPLAGGAGSAFCWLIVSNCLMILAMLAQASGWPQIWS